MLSLTDGAVFRRFRNRARGKLRSLSRSSSGISFYHFPVNIACFGIDAYCSSLIGETQVIPMLRYMTLLAKIKDQYFDWLVKFMSCASNCVLHFCRFSPCIFLYLLAVVPPIWILNLDMFHCFVSTQQHGNGSCVGLSSHSKICVSQMNTYQGRVFNLTI